MSDSNTTAAAREPRGARREPKRERSRGDGRQPVQTHAAEPPPSGRNADLQPEQVRPKVETVEHALRLQTEAAMKRAQAPEIAKGDVGGAILSRIEADDMDAAALTFLDPLHHTNRSLAPGNGGEAILQTADNVCDYPRLFDVLNESPDVLNATASHERLELASKAGALTLGVDLAETIKARNSLERMMAQQLATLHMLAMLSAASAQQMLRQHTAFGVQAQSIEAARHATTAAKLMGVFQSGYVALDRVRRGGRQIVRVTHLHQQVAVGNGGKAIVAGSIRAKGGRGKQRGVTGGEGREMASKPHAQRAPGRGWLKNGNRPGNPDSAPRCGAKTRAGTPCRAAAMRNGRCRMHGGLSTGPKPQEGIARIRASRTKHGRYSRVAIERRREIRALLRGVRHLVRELAASGD